VVARTSGKEQRGWITGSMTCLLNRSFQMSNDVYAAMLERGFGGDVRTYSGYRMKTADWVALASSLAVAVIAVLVGRFI